MAEWIDELADDLSEQLGKPPGGLRLDAEQSHLLLDGARDVSHATERLNAPLASYLVGRFVAARIAAGTDPAQALAEALEVVRRGLPEGSSD